MDELASVGLGLDYGTVHLAPTTPDWLVAGSRLRDEMRRHLDCLVEDVEQIGSSSVLGLLAKPIVDLVAGLAADRNLSAVIERMEAAGWI